MRKLLVATHGRFASGIMETFKLIMGENEDISEISAYVEPGFDMQKEAEKKIHELNEEDELIIVADIMGGSIANTFSSYIQSEKIHIITGLNLPLLIGLAQDLDSDVSTDELIENAIQMGREGIVDLKKMIEENSDIEEDFYGRSSNRCNYWSNIGINVHGIYYGWKCCSTGSICF